MQKVLSDVGEPASSMGCADSRPPGDVVPVPAEQQGSSCGLGTDLLLLVVDDVGLLDCERTERRREVDVDVEVRWEDGF